MANSYFTPAQILAYAEGSIFFATNDKLKGQLFSPRINPKLPTILDMETKALLWAYNQGGDNYPNIQQVANYVYDLCGIYAIKARNAANSGGGIPVIPVTPNPPTNCTGVVTVIASQFEADGKTYLNTAWANKNLDIYWNNVNRFIDPPEYILVPTGGFKILIPTDFNAQGNNADAVFKVFIGCFDPGMIINPFPTPINTTINVLAGSDTYDLIWTTGLAGAYGDGQFSLEQTTDGVNWLPTGNQPSYVETDNPRIYHWEGIGDLQSRIIIA